MLRLLTLMFSRTALLAKILFFSLLFLNVRGRGTREEPAEEGNVVWNWFLNKIGVDNTDDFFSDVLFPATFSVGVGWISLTLVPSQKYPRTTVYVPAIILSLGYLGIVINALVEGKTSYKDFLTLEGVAETFGEPKVAVSALYHFAVMDLLVGCGMAYDFYTSFEVKPLYRLLFTLNLLVAFGAAPVGFIFYLFFRSTIMQKFRLLKPEQWYQPKTNWQIVQEDLKDAVPTPRWYIDKLFPKGLQKPAYLVSGLVGTACFFAMLVLYVPFVLFCIVSFSLTRPLSMIDGLRGIGDNKWPIKSVVIVASHGRMFWTFNKQNLLFKVFFGWWLPLIVQFSFFLEYIPIGQDLVNYIDVLVEEFGPQFPFGQGIGFTTHKSVRSLMEDPQITKGPYSLGWRVSQAQYIYSIRTVTFYPQIPQQRFWVKQGRQIIAEWVKDIVPSMRKRATLANLDAILPYPNEDGSMIDKKVIEKSFMKAFFHLLTGGEFTKKESEALDEVLYNPGPFLPSWFNFLLGGGYLERTAMAGYSVMRAALLRYPNAPSLRNALAMAESFGWNRAETVRYLTVVFSIAGAVSPSTLSSATVTRIYQDKDKNLAMYEKNKRNFIKETARLDQQVPLVNMSAYDPEMTVHINGKNRVVPVGTSLHASIINANRDTEVFGRDARVFHGDRDAKVVNKILTWNGLEQLIDHPKQGDTPPRRCPGHAMSLVVVQYLVDRFKPPSDDHLKAQVTDTRFNSINARDLTFFVKMLLNAANAYQKNWNKNFPLASDALYPGDAIQKDLGRGTLSFGYDLPMNDEDEAPNPLVPLIQFTLGLGGPPQDYSGEFKSRNEAIGWRLRQFGKLFPPPNVDYLKFKDPVDQLVHLAFGGAASLRTKPVDIFGPDVPPGAVYVNSNRFLSTYKVRLGYEEYGAAAYFDRNCDVVGIYTEFDRKLVLPPTNLPWKEQDAAHVKQWKHAVWVWKTSALALCTVVDHLGKTHLIESTALAWSSRKHLRPTHPIRSFLKIFTYRTVSINYNAASVLTIRRGHVERIWAFQSDDLQQIFKDMTDRYKFELFRDLIDPGMRNLDDDKFPLNHDLPRFWKIVRNLVNDVFTTVYVRGPHTMDDDGEMQECIDELAEHLHLDRHRDLTTFDQIVDVFTSLICTVTAYHEHVGQVSDYFGSPDVVGATLREDKEVDSIQTYAMLVSLVCSTGSRVPRLMDSWEHLLQRDVFATENVKSLNEFQAELENLACEIERRNKKRRFPMNSFNPRKLESSVSI